jgi:MSHA biogenesis protein MshQ
MTPSRLSRLVAAALHLRWFALLLLLWGLPGAWAQVSHVSSSVGTLASNAVSSVQITKPTGLAVGDVMVAVVTQRAGSFPIVSSPPSGWTLLLNRDNGSSIGMAVYYRVATNSEPANWTWNFGASDRAAGAISAYRGVDTSAPIAASGSQANASSVSMTAPSVSPAGANAMLLGIYASQNGGITATAPSGMAEAYDAATGAGPNGIALASAYAIQAAAGASGTKVATASSAAISLGSLIALKAASAASVDHYELSLPSTGLACLASTVTVTACANSSSPCTSAATTVSGATATLATSGATLGATTVTFNSSGVATTTLSYPAAANGTAASVTLSGESTAATNPRQCCPNGTSCAAANSCSTTFNTAGLIVSASANGTAATLPAQTAGTASGTYYLRAVQTSTSTQACQAALTGASTVNWAYECNNPTTCSGANLMSLNGGVATTIQRNNNASVASTTSVPMTFDANGNAPFTFTFGDVGLTTLWASKSAGGSLLSTLAGSSNAFVVRPAGFTVTGISQTASPNLANPAAASAAGAKFVKAGESFSATVTAVTSGGVATPNFGKETVPEGVLLTRALVLPSGGATGTLANATVAGGSFSGGVATVTNLSFSEVGIITLTPSSADGDYLGSGAVTSTTTGNIGRFVPAQFAVSASTATHRAALSCSPASAFTYLGENFRLGFTLTAQNTAGTTTQNYTGSFAKLDPTVATGWNLAGRDATTAFTTASGRLSLGTATGSWSNGVASAVTITANATRAATPDGPFSASFGIAPVDSDAVAMAAFDLASASGGSNDRATVGVLALRFGRLRLANAVGAQTRALALPVTAQSWTGSAFDTNALDSCTSVPAAAVSFGNLRRTLTVADTAVMGSSVALSAGIGRLSLSAPLGGRHGSADVTLSLGSSATDASCLQPWTPGSGDAATVGANLAFLRGAWCASSYDKDPSARATWGLYRGADAVLYQRENY